MMIQQWLKEAKKQVGSLDAELIALKCFADTEVDRSWLATHDVVKITTEKRQRADEMVQKRASGVPLAYILGEKEF